MPLSRITNPFLSVSGAGNISITSPAANTIAFTTSGTEDMRINPTGNVGIGTTTPNFQLSFGANIGKTIAVFENAGTSVYGIGMGGAGTGGDPYRTKLFANGTEYASITDAGLFTVVGGQIKFPATQNASADANTLDDYEEGTYTPSVTGSTSGGPFTFGTQSGYYTKIGREVKVSMFMSHNSTVTFSGAYKISLPFSTSDYGGGGFVSYVSGWSGQSPKQFQIEASTTYGYLRGESATEMLDLLQGYIGNNTSFMLTILYKTS